MALLPKDPVHFRKLLASEMQQRGRSQAALAERMGVHQSAISRILSGDRRIKAEEYRIIDEYIKETGGRSFSAVNLVDAETEKDGLRRYPDTFEIIGESFDHGSGFFDLNPHRINNDYEIVVRTTASIVLLLQTCVFATAAALEQDEELTRLSSSVWNIALDAKIDALVRVGRLMPSEAEKLRSVLAIRDVMVHSVRKVALLDEKLATRIEVLLGEPYRADTSPELARALFGVGCSAIALRLTEPDPGAAAKILREIASSVRSGPPRE